MRCLEWVHISQQRHQSAGELVRGAGKRKMAPGFASVITRRARAANGSRTGAGRGEGLYGETEGD